jgi:hypothetical protein
MSLRLRYGLIVTLFIVGGLTILYIALTVDERVAFVLPGWLVISFLLMLFGVRCPRCKLPATVALVRLGRLRIWVPMAAVNDECPSCGADLRRPRERGDVSR